MEVISEGSVLEKPEPRRRAVPGRGRKSGKSYVSSDYCIECTSHPGKKCTMCENLKENTKVLSFTSFQEGPKKKRIKPSFICSLHCKYDIVRHVASKLGMKESLDNWNVLWSDFTVTCERIKNLKRYQKVNHFPGMIEICRKDLLARNLNRMYKIFPDDYNFYPRTWLLPTDYTEVVEYSKTHKSKSYILKPDLGCKGKGISLTRNPKNLAGLERTICQVYVARPFLIDGYKFDLRVYALITSCDPLRLYVYNEGLARFATKFYEEPNKSNISNMYMHLTNYSVNKFSRTYRIDPDDGSKRKLSTLNETLRSEYHDVSKIWREIDDVIIKTVFLGLPTLQHNYRAAVPRQDNLKTCFEVLGFDLILDHAMKPYLLEVNHSPSFHTDAPIDREVKESLLNDTFRILDLQTNNKSKVMQEDRKKATNRLLKDLTSHEAGWSKDSDNYTLEDSLRKSDIFELENIGNYRRIYPSDNSDKYNRYFCQGTSSLFNETFASRAREKATKLDIENQVMAYALPTISERSEKSSLDGPNFNLYLESTRRASPTNRLSQEERRINDGLQLDTKCRLKLTKEKSFEWIFNKIRSEKCLEKIREELPKKTVNVRMNTQKEEEKGKEEKKPPAQIPSSFFANTPYEEKRISRFNEKQGLLESVNVLEKIHKTMKTFGELKLRKDIKKVRKNRWSHGDSNADKRLSLQNSLSDVIQHIDNRDGITFEPNLNWQEYVETGPKRI